MNGRTHRDIADRQCVTRLDRRFGAAHDRRADGDALRSDDVATLAIDVERQSQVGATIRIVFQTLDLSRDAVLVATEIDDTVVLLVTTALVTGGDVTVVVATGLAGLLFDQRGNRGALVQVGIDNLDDATTARGGRLDFNECHYAALPSAKLISWPGSRHTKAFFTSLRLPVKRPKRLTLPFWVAV